MRNKRVSSIAHLIITCSLASSVLISGCEPGQFSGSTATPVPTPSNTFISAPALTSTSAPALSSPMGAGSPLPITQPIRVTNIDQIQWMASLPENPDRVFRVSSDNRLLMAADTHGIDVFDVSTRILVKHLPIGVTFNTLPYETDPTGINESHFSISASGDILAIIDFEGVKVISLEGELLYSSALEMPFSPNGSPREVTTGYSLALSPNGQYLAFYSSANGLEVIRLSDGKTIDTPGLIGDHPRFSPNGETLVTMTNNHLEFWRTTDWTKIQDIDYQGYWPLFTFVSDSTIVLHNWSNYLELWDFIHREKIHTINLQGDPQKTIILAQPLVSPNGEYLAVLKKDAEISCFEASPIMVTVFNLNGDELSEQITPFESRNCQPYFLGMAYISSPILLTDSGESITVLPRSDDDHRRTILQEMDVSFQQKILPPKAESYLQQDWRGFDYDHVFSPDGRYIALALRKGTGSATVIYDVTEDQPIYWGGAAFTSGSFSPDGTFFTMNFWNSIKMIDMSTNQNLQAVSVYEDQRLVPDAPMAVSPDLMMLAAVIAKDAMSETVGFINISDGSLLFQFPVGNDEINDLRFSADGRYLIVSTEGGWIDILGVYP